MTFGGLVLDFGSRGSGLGFNVYGLGSLLDFGSRGSGLGFNV